MKVSIITVSYNSISTIEQTILSVLNQTYKDIEYIIIDGQSTDGTCGIIEKYIDKIAYYKSEPDKGIYDAMNKGIEKATGDIVGIINSDDWYELDALEKIVGCFKTYEAELVHGKIRYIRQDGTGICTEKPVIEQIWSKMVIQHPSVFVRREVYDKYGKFDTNYDLAADYDLLLRFYSMGVKFEYVDEIIANYRIGGASAIYAYKCAYETWRASLSHVSRCLINHREDILNEVNNSFKQFKINYHNEENLKIISTALEIFFCDIEGGIVIFGAGKWGGRCFEILKNAGVPIKMFVDNDSSKWGHFMNGVEICSPKVLETSKDNVLLAVKNNVMEIESQLSGYGNPYLKWVTFNELIDCLNCKRI